MRKILSIIIPTYNSKKNIEECMDSICKQINKKVEIIIVDDGSTDGTQTIIDKYINENIKLINEKHVCKSHARNKGIEISSGDYIAFIDSDDFVSDDYIDTIFNIIKCNKYDFITFGAIVKREYPGRFWAEDKLIIKNKHIKNFNPKKIMQTEGCEPFIWNHLFKKDIIKNNRT